jgi:glutathione S-transferase
LYESRAICKYLCQKYSFPLLPSASDLEATALFDQALSTESLYFADPAGKLGFEKFAKKLMGLEPNEAVVAEAEKGTQAYLDVAEKLLGEKEYMAGNEFTLADVFYVPLVGRLFASGYGEWIVGRPNVAKWWERVSERPAIKELIRKDREVLEKMRK